MADSGSNNFFRRGHLFASTVAVMAAGLLVSSCGALSSTYRVTKGAAKATYGTAKLACKATVTTGKLAYKTGKFTYEVIKAPLDWPLTHDLESIDGLSPREAIRQGRVKRAPYVINGRLYTPMTLEEASCYREEGVASWYGEETRRRSGGRMTANGEVFDPGRPSAAHKLLPLPAIVRVVNLENGRSMVLRVNDRGPFVSGRIIDVSAEAAKQLGFYKKGTARVVIETVEL